MPGQEFTLAGAYTGRTYMFPTLPGTSIYDGTSDGTHIYGWDYIQNRVVQFDPYWSNPLPLFSINASAGDYMGITYEPDNNSLWISGWNLAQVRNYSLTGQLLGAFSISHDHAAALAFDPVTDTLWLANVDVPGSFEEYSRTGTLLSTQVYPYLGGMRVLGAEFQVVPEPTIPVLLALVLVSVGCLRAPRFLAMRHPGPRSPCNLP